MPITFVRLPHTEVAQNVVYRGMPQFPGRLVECLGDRAPRSLWIAGVPELIHLVDSGHSRSVALAASVESPASVAEETSDLVRELALRGAVFIGGFHSPLERLCLDELVVSARPAILFLGRTLSGLRTTHRWLQPLKDGKLVLVSACGPSHKRATLDSVQMRNDCVLALADCFVIPHASVGGKTETLCREVLKARKTVWTLNQAESRNLIALGAKLATAGKANEILNSGRKSLAASSNPGE